MAETKVFEHLSHASKNLGGLVAGPMKLAACFNL